MNLTEEKYILKILSFLEKGSKFTKEEMLLWLKMHPQCYDFQEDGHGYQYCLVSYPLTGLLQKTVYPQKIVLLVFENDTVIGDIAAVVAPSKEMFNDDETIDAISDLDTWTQSCLYVLRTACLNSAPSLINEGMGCIYTNAYVTTAYRRQGIFKAMVQMVMDFCIQNRHGSLTLFQVISLDPDVACYGPDSSDEPYYYSMEQDEPKRELNADIIEKLGFQAVQLEHTEEDSLSDGTFIWYGIRLQRIIIVDRDDHTYPLS